MLLLTGTATARAGTDPIPTTTTITCDLTKAVYTGAPVTPCTASVQYVSGQGGGSFPATVTYSNNVNATDPQNQSKWARAEASFSGAGFAPSRDVEYFPVSPRHIPVDVTCPSYVTYTGSALTPCTATVDGQDATGSLDYGNNVEAGTATATIRVFGDPNNVGAMVTRTFIIRNPATTVTVTCSDATYTGADVQPCSAIAKDTSGTILASQLPVTYSDNVNAGTATATASYAGDATHLASTGKSTFTIAKAPTTLVLSCSDHVIFTGSALTPCNLGVLSVGVLTTAPLVSYSDNIAVGDTPVVTAIFAGDANHLPTSTTATFTITPAPVTVSVSCPASVDFTGAALTPCTAAVTGPGGLAKTLTPTYSTNTYAGTATASATYPAAGNYQAGTGSTTFQVKGFTFTGYLSPVATSSTKIPVWNTVKAGSTVPLKYEAFLPNGTEITTTTALGATFTAAKVTCPTTTTSTTVTVNGASSGTTALTYDPASGQFVQTWKTPKQTGCYEVTTTTADHSTLIAYFSLR